MGKREVLEREQEQAIEADELLSDFADIVSKAQGVEDYRAAQSLLMEVLAIAPGHRVATAYVATLSNFLSTLDLPPVDCAGDVSGSRPQTEDEETEEEEEEEEEEMHEKGDANSFLR